MTGVRDPIERELTTARDTRTVLLSLGWPVYRSGRAVFLSTTSGFCGLKVTGGIGEQMLVTLRNAGVNGPVIEIPWPNSSYVFLADADVVLDAAMVSPRGAVLLQAPSAIPLPPSETPRGRLTWIVPPRLTNRWLPGLSTVRWALTMAA
jgi:hypothetical protein